MSGIKLVSIIVPVYGVEAYLAECVDSLLAQTYRNLEIILVDDGGKDRSAEICDQYALKDNRIKVIHKKNGGAASARNVGIDAATGEYICFVDGDDVVERDYVFHLWTALSEADADISECGLFSFTKSKKTPIEIDRLGVFDNKEYLIQFTMHWTCALMTNKLFKRSVVGDVRFVEGHCIDDEFFTYRIVMNSKKIVVTEPPLYGYRMRGSSVMHDTVSNAERIMLDRIEYINIRYEDVRQRYPALEQAFFLDLVDAMTSHWRSSYQMTKAQGEIRKWVRRYIGKILRTRMPLRTKLVYVYLLCWTKPKDLPAADDVQKDLSDYFN